MTETRSLSKDAPGSTYAPRYIPGQGLVSAQTGESVQYSDAPQGYADGKNDDLDSNYSPSTGSVDPAMTTAPQPSATPTAGPIQTTPQSPQPAGGPVTPQGALPYSQALANVPAGPNQSAVQANLAKAYGVAHQNLQAGGQPNQMGGNRSAIQNAVNQATPQQQQNDPMQEQFYTTNPFIKQTMDQTMEFLSPKSTNDSLQKYLDDYSADRESLKGLKVDLMNNKRLMAGNEEMIRDEITKAGGFATEGQVEAMTFARNKHLVYANSILTDQIATAQDAINTDTQMLGIAKDAANTQFNQRMSLLNYQQENSKFMYNAAQDQFKTNLSLLGADGLYQSMQSNPNMISYYEKLNNLPSGALATAAAQATKERANAATKDQLSLDLMRSNLETDKVQRANIYSQIAERNATALKSKNLASFVTPPVINPKTGKADPRNQLASVVNTTGIKSDDKLKLTGSVISAIQAMAERNPDGKFAGLGFGQIVPGPFASQAAQSNRTDLSALKGTVESWMTGASVAPDQQKRINNDMVPKNGDPDIVTRQKLNSLTNYMLNYASGSLASQGVNFTPQPVDFFSKPVVTAPDGQQIIITN